MFLSATDSAGHDLVGLLGHRPSHFGLVLQADEDVSIGPFPAVHLLHVQTDVALPLTAVVALLALVRLELGVRLQVHKQMPPPPKGLVALRTLQVFGIVSLLWRDDGRRKIDRKSFARML